eukprot:scpid37831/ scgid31171/ 
MAKSQVHIIVTSMIMTCIMYNVCVALGTCTLATSLCIVREKDHSQSNTVSDGTAEPLVFPCSCIRCVLLVRHREQPDVISNTAAATASTAQRITRRERHCRISHPAFPGRGKLTCQWQWSQQKNEHRITGSPGRRNQPATQTQPGSSEKRASPSPAQTVASTSSSVQAKQAGIVGI